MRLFFYSFLTKIVLYNLFYLKLLSNITVKNFSISFIFSLISISLGFIFNAFSNNSFASPYFFCLKYSFPLFIIVLYSKSLSNMIIETFSISFIFSLISISLGFIFKAFSNNSLITYKSSDYY